MLADEIPLVSVVIPCFNERAFIGSCLDSIIDNNYPKDRLEVLVVDGISDDGTRPIINQYCKDYGFMKMVDNPDRIKPAALNTGIRNAHGEIILRMDAHAVYEPDYISKSVHYVRKYDADNVGGVRRTLPRENTVLGRAIALSISHRFAAGNAAFRTGSQEPKWVDTVFGGCYPKDVFDRIGLFDETLIRGQDREFNVRLRREGGRILLHPDIVCYYFARSELRSFVPWIFAGGLTPFYVSRIVGEPILSWRNFVPLTFVLTLTCWFLLSFVDPRFLCVFAGVAASYVLTCTGISIAVALKEKDIRLVPAMFLIFSLTHVLYGIGSLVGIFKPVRRGAEWSRV